MPARLSCSLITAVALAMVSPAVASADSPVVAYWPMTGPNAEMQDIVGGHDGVIGPGILIGNGIYGFTAKGEVTVPSSPVLDAGQRPFRVTARIAVPPHNFHDYSVIQKGLSLQPGLWKMAVTDNVPSCGFDTLHVVAPAINDTAFHTISCIRMPTYIAIQVDSSIYGKAGSVGNLVNDFPVTVGGKPPNGAKMDYFFGYMTGISISKY